MERRSGRRQRAWLEAYVTSFVQRDVREISNISGLLELPTILRILATRVGQPLNVAELSRQTGIQATTLRRYLGLLEAAYFVHPLPAWSVNLGKRLTKTSKLLIPDSGLLCYLLGLDSARFTSEPVLLGPVLENFVGGELLRQLGWSESSATLYYLRTQAGEEVDFVLETPAGKVVAIEVKASRTLGYDHWKGLRTLRQALPDRFHRGIVFYRGEEVLPLSEKILALPIPALWSL